MANDRLVNRLPLMAQPELIVNPADVEKWFRHYQHMLNVSSLIPAAQSDFITRVEHHIAMCDLSYRQLLGMRL